MSDVGSDLGSEDLDFLLAEIGDLETENEQLEEKTHGLNKQIKNLSNRAGNLTLLTEKEEEHIANGLFRRMDGLREENLRLTTIMEVEEQEAKDIVQRIAAVRQRRVELENKMEVEQESQMNKLHKSLVDLAGDKSVLEKKLHNERAAYLTELHHRISVLGAASPLPDGASSPTYEGEGDQSIADLKAEVDKLLKAERINLNGSGEGGSDADVASEGGSAEQLATTLRQLQMDRIIVKNKSERVKEQLEKAQADLVYETELQTRLGHDDSGGNESQSTGYHSMDQESLRTQSSDSSGGIRLDRSDLRAHTHRVLNSATPTPIHDPRRGTPPRTPPESTRSHSSAGHRSELSSGLRK